MSETAEVNLPNEGTFKWQGYSFVPGDISTYNLFVLTQQGIAHKMGNECASRLVAWTKTDEGKDASDEAKAAKLKEFRDEMAAKILGTEKLGVRVGGGGTRLTGVEALKKAIALEFLKAMLDGVSKKTGNKVSVPTGDNTITIAGKVMNREQLIEATMRKRAADIEAEVARRQAARDEGAADVEDIFGE